MIEGLVAFSAAGTPTAIPSVAGIAGGGGVGAGYLSGVNTPYYSNYYGALPNGGGIEGSNLAARFSNATYTNLIAFSTTGGNNGMPYSYALGNATATPLGSDSALGVNWGVWDVTNGNYIANYKSNGYGSSASPIGNFYWMTASHITTPTELAALTGSAAFTSAAPGGAAYATGTDSSISYSVASITATSSVNFTNQTMDYVVNGSSSVLGGTFFAATATPQLISNFMSSSGIPLTGASYNGTLNGFAKGGFVGSQASAMISSFALWNSLNQGVTGVAYLKRYLP